MSEKISSRSKRNSGYYKGHAPLRSDEILYLIVETILQIIILTFLYSRYINEVRIEHGTSIIVETFFVIIWMVISDIIAAVLAYLAREGYDLFLHYMRKEKKKKPRGRSFIQYIIYTLFRSIIYAAGVITFISALLYPHAQIVYFNFSYLLAWLIISLPLRLLAWGLAWGVALKFNV